ncbi:T-cell surface antigen CD2-like [Sinocyclocheilus anshuiensis]|uniref:T-cell surface antigen CD2-like n=1 Tax=Sinocyclocheilus anshuiensis TaxID=1608454 RepID=UPI0007B7AD16|nr:PREDICTED: T-cell surface antigen CD2-like [Sinocyclocheilus anshuiensis]
MFLNKWRHYILKTTLSVFGVDEVKSVSVMEGDSATLNINDTDIQKEDQIMWRFGHILIAHINRKNNKSMVYDDKAGGRFRDRLKLDNETVSLSITNTRTTDSGVYNITSKRSETPLNIFNLTVYAHLPVPVISRDCASSSSSSSYCSLLCSVVNVSHVTLSWYKGNSLMSSINESDLSISLSLPLEVEYQDNNTYSCVLNNPISNQTTHLDISRLCQTYTEHGLTILYTVLISAAGFLLIVAAVMIFCTCRKPKKVNQEGKYDLMLIRL